MYWRWTYCVCLLGACRNNPLKSVPEEPIAPTEETGTALSTAETGIGDTATPVQEPITEWRIDIPRFHPEGVALDASGNGYISSFETGAIAWVPAGNSVAEIFVEEGVIEGQAAGLAVVGELLWACGADFDGVLPSALYAFRLSDGEIEQRFDLPGGGFCNDMAVAPDGTLYVTDSFNGRVLRLMPGEDALQEWAQAAEWAPGASWPLSLNGIAHDGQSTLYLDRSDNGALYQLAIDGDVPGAWTTLLPETAFGSDGMEWLGNGRLAVIRAFAVVEIADTGAGWAPGEIFSNELDEPAALILDGEGSAWVTEARFRTLGTPDDDPFWVRKIPIE